MLRQFAAVQIACSPLPDVLSFSLSSSSRILLHPSSHGSDFGNGQAGIPLQETGLRLINGKGELVDRVQIPVNRTIVGFGTGGVVYMSYTENGNTKLERATLK